MQVTAHSDPVTGGVEITSERFRIYQAIAPGRDGARFLELLERYASGGWQFRGALPNRNAAYCDIIFEYVETFLPSKIDNGSEIESGTQQAKAPNKRGRPRKEQLQPV